MNGNGFDISVVELQTVRVAPGMRARLIVECDGEQSVIMDVHGPAPIIVQCGFDLESSIKSRLAENQLRYIYNAGGKISIQVQPRAEGKVKE